VTVRGELLTQCVLPRLAAPGSSKADEEFAVELPHILLVAGLAAERPPIRVERGGEAAEIGNVLDQRSFAVDRHVG